eukprot:CAMPEP_0197184904 /NCGR_PEP_ID=MMETSP1423-20130617/10814_1 /TAXON_ID=476441 /ORGANISM="Pseudo-nitzschia heimii, Strain UNC1101" /LENGTH=638 /DNA_ID=CAMNT_0042635847 /DNA_START=82 /DNA_END=1995 /DNA_ORIENTATION=+
MAIPAGLVFLFSVIPVVLATIAALLLDRVLKYETTFNRCQIQILMWIVLSTISSKTWLGPSKSRNDDISESVSNGSGIDHEVVCSVLVQLTIFFNLMVPLGELLQKRLEPTPRWTQMVWNGIQILPLSSCLTMIMVTCYVLYLNAKEAITEVEIIWKVSIFIFLGAFLGLWLFRFSTNRSRKVLTDMQGMPMPVTTAFPAASGPSISGGIMARFCGVITAPATFDYKSSFQDNQNCWLDERQWYRWSRAQTMQWFGQKLSSKIESDISNKKKEMVVAILAPHHITGDILDRLVDVSQLVALRVPFGPACRLSDSVAEMVERYPKANKRNGAKRWTSRSTDNMSRSKEAQNNFYVRVSNDCLNLHDQQYNCESRKINEEREGVNHNIPTKYPPGSSLYPEGQHLYENEPVIHGDASNEQQEKLNKVLKERFGLELPKLKARDFLEVRKGLSNEANNTKQAAQSTDNGVSQSPSFRTTELDRNINSTMRNGCANGAAVSIQQRSQQFSYSPSSSDMDGIHSSTPPSKGIPPSTGITQHILDGMPSELREIAKRRPDLVQTAWNQKQQNVAKQPGETSTAGAFPAVLKRDIRLPSLLESTQSMRREDRMDGDDIDYDSADEDETTFLINRDDTTRTPSRYK